MKSLDSYVVNSNRAFTDLPQCYLTVELRKKNSGFGKFCKNMQKFVDSLIEKIYLSKLREYYINCHVEG